MKMKKIFFVLAVILFFIAQNSFAGTSTNTEVGVDSYQGQGQGQSQVGGTQSIVFNSTPADEITYRSYIQANAGTELLFAPPTHYYPQNPWTIWLDVPQILAQQLYSLEKAAKLAENDRDVIQFVGNPLTIGANNDPIRLLPKNPMGENDIKLWEIWIEGPTNSFLSESILRAVSIGKAVTGAKRVFIKYREFAHSINAGNAFGNATGTSLINGTTAWANSVSPQFGKSEARAYPVHNVIVSFYNDGPIPNAPMYVKKDKPVQKDLPDLIYFTDNGLELQETKIAKNTEWLKKRWLTIRKKGVKIIFNSVYLDGQNPSSSEDMAYNVMMEVGNNLLEEGISAEELEDTLLYNAKPANPGQKNTLKKEGKAGVVMITTQG